MKNLSDPGWLRRAAMAAHAAPIRVLLLLIAAYRYLISPMMAPHCRYHPSCSEYAQDALAKHGAYLGARLALKRLCRCHPWQPGGYDPVP